MRLLRVVFAALVVLASSLIWPASAEALKAWSNSISAASIVFSADGSRFAVIGDKAIGVWNAKTGHPIHIFASFKDPITAAAISPDGRTLATATGINNARFDDIRLSSLQLWDVDSGNLKKTIANQNQTRCVFYALAFTRSGQSIVSGGGDQKVRFWSVSTGRVQKTFVFGTSVDALACSPDGRVIVAAHSQSFVKAWKISTGRMVFMSKQRFFSTNFSFSHNSRLLIVGGTVWDVERSRRAGILPEPSYFGDTDAPATFDSNDHSLICVEYTQTTSSLTHWILRTSKGQTIKRLDQSVKWIAFSPDGKSLIGMNDSDHNLKRVQIK